MGDKHVGLGAGAVLVGYGRVRRERGGVLGVYFR